MDDVRGAMRYGAYVFLSWVAILAAGAAFAGQKLPPVGHVFIIVLENHSYADTFGKQSKAPYLSKTLTAQGALLSNYYGIGHNSLDNYIAMISGQPPNEDTQSDCEKFIEFQQRDRGVDARGVLLGHGCVYPGGVKTLAGQLDASHRSWKAYMEDMGNAPVREAATCGHPSIGSKDITEVAVVNDQYAAKHNPFVYFHSIIDDRAYCSSHVVNLNRLTNDLAAVSTTSNFIFITPNLCHDGHDAPCINREAGGLASSNEFLRQWVPIILNSPAYKKDGLLVITFDEAGANGPEDSDACCGEVGMAGAKYPPGMNGPGGGRIGAVLLSPFIRPGTVSQKQYNHYALLKSIEDIFSLSHLAEAAGPKVSTFGDDIFSSRKGP